MCYGMRGMSDKPRWRQRFENLHKAYSLLAEGATAESLTPLESEGLIQRFEYTFELCWKTLKDFLNDRGVEVSFPRDALKAAFQQELVSDGDLWLEMLDMRNTMAHTYNEDSFNKAVEAVRIRFFPAIRELVANLETLED